MNGRSAGCDEWDERAAELALGLLPGTERAAALRHLDGCAACRTLVEDLARTADSVLLASPDVEPPSGFEDRVLAAQPARVDRRRRPWLATAAVGAAAALLAAVAAVALLGDDADDGVRRATFLVDDGTAAGQAVLYDQGEPLVFCTFEGSRAQGDYDVEVVLDDGTTLPLGSFEAEDGSGSYGTPLTVDPDRVASLNVRDPAGEVRLTAAFDDT